MQGFPRMTISPSLVAPATIGLLILSNIFMTFAWYGHLKFKAAPLLMVILVSWGIAFFNMFFRFRLTGLAMAGSVLPN